MRQNSRIFERTESSEEIWRLTKGIKPFKDFNDPRKHKGSLILPKGQIFPVNKISPVWARYVRKR